MPRMNEEEYLQMPAIEDTEDVASYEAGLERLATMLLQRAVAAEDKYTKYVEEAARAKRRFVTRTVLLVVAAALALMVLPEDVMEPTAQWCAMWAADVRARGTGLRTLLYSHMRTWASL